MPIAYGNYVTRNILSALSYLELIFFSVYVKMNNSGFMTKVCIYYTTLYIYIHEFLIFRYGKNHVSHKKLFRDYFGKQMSNQFIIFLLLSTTYHKLCAHMIRPSDQVRYITSIFRSSCHDVAVFCKQFFIKLIFT